MTVETLFSVASLLVVPFWALMILAPGWGWTRRVVGSPWIAAPLAVPYGLLVLPRVGEVFAAFDSAAGVAGLLGIPWGATVAWLHFLAFDLFVGRWVYLDGRERGIHPLAMAPVLLLTFLLGPLGFLAYLVLARLWPPAGRRTRTIGASAPS